MVDHNDLGARVRMARRKLHITQDQLAERVGISASYLGHIERGTRACSLDTLVDLCNALDIAPGALLQSSLTVSDPLQTDDMTPTERQQVRTLVRLAQRALRDKDEKDEDEAT